MVLGHDISKGTRTQDVQISQNVTFDSMLLMSNTLNGLLKSGFYRPSPIQLHGIPLGKCGFDLLLEAKSGTGKTAVFTITALEKLDLEKGLQVVILAPTREIAAQICDVIKQIGSYFDSLKVEVVMGGLPVSEDISKFEKNNVHIVVGSPGRLRHLIRDKHIDISAVRLLVLDEADKLMEKSFQPDLNYIFSSLPKQKQVIMSSATYPDSARSFIGKYVQNAQPICPDTNCVLLGVRQKVTTVKYNANIVKQTQNKFEELLKILSQKQFKQCLIFCNYQARVQELHKMLRRKKWPAEQLYGQQQQTDRLDALKTLQEYKCRILISTDLAARGIDASNVDLVINFEPPSEWQTYLHRIGRAGRFGTYGIAVTILSEGKEEQKILKLLESFNITLDNFWNDDECNYDSKSSLSLQHSETSECEPLLFTNIQVEETYQKLKDMLTGVTHQDLMQTETYETTCKSIEENNRDSKIEPFSDLFHSFQNHEQEVNTHEINTYEVMKSQIKCAAECFITMQKMEDSMDKLFEKKELLHNNEELVKNDNSGNKNNKRIKKTLEDQGYSLNKANNSVCSNGKEIQHEDISEMKGDHDNPCEYVFEDSTEALRKAGLPTSFGKKPTNRYEKSNTYSQKRDKYISTENLYEDYRQYSENPKQKIRYPEKSSCSNINDTDPAFFNYRHKKSNSKIRQNTDTGSSDTSSHSDGNYYYVPHKYRTFSKIKDPNEENCRIRSNYNVNKPNNYKTDAHNSKSPSQSYVDWFNQLKFRVKQIEFAIYIEEMSKLQ